MARFRTVMAMVAIAAVGLALASCSRKITRVDVVQQPQTCFACHSDTNTAIVTAQLQWQNSKHASGGTLNENNGDCKGCHTSEGFVARATGTTIPDVVDNPTPIHCFTCHSPHTSGNLGLRWTAVATLLNGTTFDLHSGNLCAACHHARRSVSTYVTARTTLSSRWGPHHGPQADMLLGSNGYEYAGFTYDRTSHREATTANGKDGCLECHMKTTDRLVVGGHSFNMEAVTNGDTLLNVAACAPCHGTIAEFNDVDGIQAQVGTLITDLSARLQTAGLLGSNGLPKSVTTSADSAGAVWNLLMAQEDRSLGVHNAKYIIGLLQSSIQFLQPPGQASAVAARGRR